MTIQSRSDPRVIVIIGHRQDWRRRVFDVDSSGCDDESGRSWGDALAAPFRQAMGVATREESPQELHRVMAVAAAAARSSDVAALLPAQGLHVSTQAVLADYIAKGAGRVVITTHSRAIVDRLGEHIEIGTMGQHDVIVKIAKADRVRLCGFDKNGLLENWEYGWFDVQSDAS